MGLTNEDRVALAAVVPWSPTALTEVTAAVQQIIARHVTEARAAALNEAARAIHLQRFANDEGLTGGPDNYYNGAITAARIVRLIANSPPP